MSIKLKINPQLKAMENQKFSRREILTIIGMALTAVPVIAQ
ncbi:hypothetical protein H1P_100025 [Hyella patelloides LEGE 07179]|uniref:Uncharacterized protein n=1 Tax=Hyella patelloides LEGE 07179 TaxID=945734 RepID=A0A563VIV7_9CYAN|nr:hypothetical protein H1P_100025 [Hyella patelloides LEGE 07179]